MKLLVAIPALNESLAISAVIKQVKTEIGSATVLVVDDGSKDSTADVARLAGALVISMPFNVGVGGAMRVAFKFALENGYTHVLQIDADGQHLPSEAKELLKYSVEDCVVVGSRFLDPNSDYQASSMRKIAMTILAKVTSFICKTKLTDVTSGFRLASGRAIELFAIEYPREYLGDTVESLIIAHRNGILIREVSVSMRKRQHGVPSQNLIKSVWYLTRALLIIALTMFKKRDKNNGVS